MAFEKKYFSPYVTESCEPFSSVNTYVIRTEIFRLDSLDIAWCRGIPAELGPRQRELVKVSLLKKGKIRIFLKKIGQILVL